MNTLDVFVLLLAGQKLNCELVVKNRFGWQVDDVLPGRTEDEQVLKFIIHPKSENQYAAFFRLLEQQKRVGAIKDFLPKPAYLPNEEETGGVEQVDASSLARRVVLAEETLSYIETGWIGQDLPSEQLSIVQDALQEYMDRRQLLRSNGGNPLGVADPSLL